MIFAASPSGPGVGWTASGPGCLKKTQKLLLLYMHLAVKSNFQNSSLGEFYFSLKLCRVWGFGLHQDQSGQRVPGLGTLLEAPAPLPILGVPRSPRAPGANWQAVRLKPCFVPVRQLPRDAGAFLGRDDSRNPSICSKNTSHSLSHSSTLLGKCTHK